MGRIGCVGSLDPNPYGSGRDTHADVDANVLGRAYFSAHFNYWYCHCPNDTSVRLTYVLANRAKSIARTALLMFPAALRESRVAAGWGNPARKQGNPSRLA